AFRQRRIANPLVVARDGVEGLAHLRGEGVPPLPRPNVVLVDINMPRMNGLEFITEVRKDPVLRDLVVFVLTTSRDEEDRMTAYHLNVAGYIVKSDLAAGFVEAVNMLDCYWHVVELPQ